MANTSEEMIKQMYESQLKSQKEQLQSDYNAANSQLDVQKQQNQKVTDANLTRSAVESQKAAVSDAEYYAAAGLTSGAKAQARLARENQLQSDLTAIRTAQQEADAETERQRALLSQEYTAAIRKAQAENDFNKAQALYEEAKQQEAKLLQQQKDAASLLGAVGDFSLHGTAYGMTADQTAALKTEFDRQAAEAAAAKAEAERQQKQKEQAAMAEILASMGNYSGFAGLYGITPEQVAAMQKEYDDAQAKTAAEQEAQAEQQRQAEERAKLEAAAKLMASGGDFSRYGALYGLTDAEIALLNALYAAETGGSTPPKTEPEPEAPVVPDIPVTEIPGSALLQSALIGALGPVLSNQEPVQPKPLFQNSTGFDNMGLDEKQIKHMQKAFGVEEDGMWGNQSAAAAGGRNAQQAWDFYMQEFENGEKLPEYQLGINAKNIIKSLETMRGMMGSEKGIANSIIAYATQNKISMDEAEYMLRYFGYDPEDYIE